MSINERELRSRLAEAAALAGPPDFTADDLTARVRRIRRRRRASEGIIAAACVAAIIPAVAIPLTRGGASQPVSGGASQPVSGRTSQPATIQPLFGPPPEPPRLSYTVTANGQKRAVPPTTTGEPLFTITPGERLTVTVQVIVPRPHVITALWLGITEMLSGHDSMNPLLAASSAPLRPGSHRFVLHWTVPAGLKPGTSRQLSAEWDWPGPEPGQAEGNIADFAVPLPPGAASPAEVTRRLRTMALNQVASCDGVRPSILAVRTTFSKAMAVVGRDPQIADNATDAVYLVLMKGDFVFPDGSLPLLCDSPPYGHYFTAEFDAATLVNLESGLGNSPPRVPPQTLGPVLNLTEAGR